MDKSILSILKFHDYKVDTLEFIHNPNYDPDNAADIDFNVNFKVQGKFEEKTAIVTLSSEIKDPENSNRYPFSLKISVSGYFSVEPEEEITEQYFVKFCKLNGTTALFPFFRSTIADITRTCNSFPLIIPLINVSNFTNE